MKDDFISNYFYEDDKRAFKLINMFAMSVGYSSADLRTIDIHDHSDWPVGKMQVCFTKIGRISAGVYWHDCQEPTNADITIIPLIVDNNYLVENLWAHILLAQMFTYKDGIGYTADKDFMVDECPVGFDAMFLHKGQAIEEFIVKFELEMHI